MTRKKIDLATATEDWMKARYKRPTGLFGYEGHVESLLGGNLDHPQREERLQTDRWATLLSDALDLTSNISTLWVEPRHGKITIFVNCSFDAKGLNRLMNSEIHHEGQVYVFDHISLEARMEGERGYDGLVDYARAYFEISYKTAK